MTAYDITLEFGGQRIHLERHKASDYRAYFQKDGYVSSAHPIKRAKNPKEALKFLIKSIDEEIKDLEQIKEEIKNYINN